MFARALGWSSGTSGRHATFIDSSFARKSVTGLISHFLDVVASLRPGEHVSGFRIDQVKG